MRGRRTVSRVGVSRRDLLRGAGLGLVGFSASGWLPVFADQVAADPNRRRHCILLWMSGGPSQTDTFDMKPEHTNGGEFGEIETAASGLRICEHLPKLAEQAGRLAVVRGLSTKEGDHGRGTFLMRTGHRPGGPIRYPAIGASLSKELGDPDAELPSYVSILPYQTINSAAFSPGFLGPAHAPTTVGAVQGYQAPDATEEQPRFAELGVDYLHRPPGVDEAQRDARLKLWEHLQAGFLARRGGSAATAQHTVYRRAVRMMQSKAAAAFDLSTEPDAVREAYGPGRFGQGCLMARRLIEQGVPFVEVTLGAFEAGSVGWDTHRDNFPTVRSLCEQLDAGWGTLMRELEERGLLDSTTILWMGEFGRTPVINNNAGRDHWPGAWSCVLAGGGIRGGQAYGRTSADGTTVEEGQVDVGDVLATLCQALGVDPATQNFTEQQRPIRIAEGTPIAEILA